LPSDDAVDVMPAQIMAGELRKAAKHTRCWILPRACIYGIYVASRSSGADLRMRLEQRLAVAEKNAQKMGVGSAI